MADETPVVVIKQTCSQKLLFYVTAFFILLGVFSLFAFLFLVPFVIDPAFTTIFMQFQGEPVQCVTVSAETYRGASNCTWSSCKEGCTKELYECTQIIVNYKRAENTTVDVEDPSGAKSEDEAYRRTRSILEESFRHLAEGYRSMFVSEREPRGLRDYDYDLSMGEDLKGGKNNSEWLFTGARLFPNVKGCGYPPTLNCSIFLKKYREIGKNYSCYYSLVEPSLVINEFDINQVYMNLVYAMAIPIPSFIISVIYLTFAYFVIYAEETPPRPLPLPASTSATPVPPPTSGALTPASEDFREDLVCFGHNLKVAMADEASRESVATCNDAVPNSNSIPDGTRSWLETTDDTEKWTAPEGECIRKAAPCKMDEEAVRLRNLTKTLTTSISTPPGPIAAV